MNLCPKGHDKDKVGVTTRFRCRECDREHKRGVRAKNRIPCTHAGPCDPITYRNGAVHCRVRLREFGIKGGNVTRIARTDGWEDEFGPVPSRVPNSVWIDWVAVDRYLEGRPARDLTSGEYRALHLLEVLRRGAPGGDSEPDLVPMIKTSVWHPKGTGSQLRLRRKVG